MYQVEALNKSYNETAGNLCIYLSTIRTVDLFNMAGKVDKRKHPPNSGTAVLDKLIISGVISYQPDVYLQEILAKETSTTVAESAI